MSESYSDYTEVQETLKAIGSNIKNARKRRRVSMAEMASQSHMTRVTLSNIENGLPTVSLWAYGKVLFNLGLLAELSRIADPNIDILGRKMEEENLPQRIRKKKYKGNKNDSITTR